MTTAFFVAADWLAEHIDDPEIQILDARMAPPDRNIVIWRANIAPDIFPARCFLILKRFPIAHRRCRI